MKDTIRLIITKDCNFHCGYCCNEKERFNSQFIEKTLDEVDFSKYQNVCISGGEPFLNYDLMMSIIDSVPNHPIYIYSNGVLIKDRHIKELKSRQNIRGFNIGLHHVNQIKHIIPIEKELPVRYMIQDKNYEKVLSLFPDRLNQNNTKKWTMDQCDMPNEDWVVLVHTHVLPR